MKRSLIGLLVVVVLSIVAIAVFGATSAINLYFPATDKATVTTPRHYIVGEVDTLRVMFLELTQAIQKSETLEVNSYHLNDDFVRIVKKMFDKNLLITNFTLTIQPKDPGKKPVILNTQCKAADRVDLRKFTQLPEFLKIYEKALADTAISTMKFEVSGLQGRMIDLTQARRREKMGRIFVFRIDLAPGRNDYVIRAMAAGWRIIEEKTVSFNYKPSFDANIEDIDNFTANNFHTGESEKVCAECHRMQPNAYEIGSTTAVTRMCYPCHAWETVGKSVHPPLTDWTCFYCHSASTPKVPGYPVSKARNSAETCFECHSDLKDLVDKAKVKHAPFEGGECMSCHTTHSSSQLSLLITDVNKLCLSCHEPKYAKDHPVMKHPLSGVRDPNNTKRELSCISCHNPHATENAKLFTKAASMSQLCQECHKK